MHDTPGYRAFLIRLWQAGDPERLVWRASALDPHTGERHGFVDLDGLFAFLEAQTKVKAGRRKVEGEKWTVDDSEAD